MGDRWEDVSIHQIATVEHVCAYCELTIQVGQIEQPVQRKGHGKRYRHKKSEDCHDAAVQKAREMQMMPDRKIHNGVKYGRIVGDNRIDPPDNMERDYLP